MDVPRCACVVQVRQLAQDYKELVLKYEALALVGEGGPGLGGEGGGRGGVEVLGICLWGQKVGARDEGHARGEYTRRCQAVRASI